MGNKRTKPRAHKSRAVDVDGFPVELGIKRSKSKPWLFYVRHEGRAFFFGPAGRSEAEAERLRPDAMKRYRTWKAERQAAGSLDGGGALTVRDLVVRYRAAREAEHGEGWLKRGRVGMVCDLLEELYGDTIADDYGPRRLEATRRAMMDRKQADGETPALCRSEINRCVTELRAVFSWGLAKELLNADRNLKAVKGLKRGAEGTREGRGRRAAVDHEVVKKTIPHLAEPFRTIVCLIHSTGARPSEVIKLRAGDIDRSDPEQWVVVLGDHKDGRA